MLLPLLVDVVWRFGRVAGSGSRSPYQPTARRNRELLVVDYPQSQEACPGYRTITAPRAGMP